MLRTKTIIVSLSALALSLSLVGCGNNNVATPSQKTAPSEVKTDIPVEKTEIKTEATTSAEVELEKTKNIISIKDSSFTPNVVIVKKDTKVTWVNNDSVPHQIKSKAFSSSVLNTGQSFSFTFKDSGAYDYSCVLHPKMVGRIIVQ